MTDCGQPKGLFELAFGSFITYMESETRQLMKLDPSPEAVTVTSRVCRELKRFFHDTRLPTFVANELTKHLLIKLDSMYYMFESSIRTECCQQMLLSLVEVFMHPDITAIELGPSYFHGFDYTYSNFITSTILPIVRNLHSLKVLNLPIGSQRYFGKDKLVFPFTLKELTIRDLTYTLDEVLRSVVDSCPGLTSLTMCIWENSDLTIPLILQCKNLKTLHLSRKVDVKEEFHVALLNSLPTDTTSDVLSTSTLRSFGVRLREEISLRLIVDKLPHLSEIILFCEIPIDLSSLAWLKNLRSLSLDVNFDENSELNVIPKCDECKKILPILGKNLVFLELLGHCTLDLECIGETCTQLKCLHLSLIPDNRTHSKHFPKTFPNFKTIECLRIEMSFDPDLAAFLIAQCVNIKTLIVELGDTLENPLYSAIDSVLRRTPLLKLLVIIWPLFKYTDATFVKELRSKYPNFHVVQSYRWIKLSSMSGNLQPKGLSELAFGSFITYMENEARQLMKLRPSPEAVTVTSRVCSELKRFFHGLRLPSSIANELTKHLLIKLDYMNRIFKSPIRAECCRQMLLILVDVFMHPDVTAIELGQSSMNGFDFKFCLFITWMILVKVRKMNKLKILNLPSLWNEIYFDGEVEKLVFPSQLNELVLGSCGYTSYEILRSVVEFCPELKSLNIQYGDISESCIPIILQCKHLKSLHLPNYDAMDEVYVDIITGLSTDATSDVLSASTLLSVSLNIIKESTLLLIVDKLPHLTEINLFCMNDIDLSCLTQRKGLQSLSLEGQFVNSLYEYKKILPVLGKQLMCFELKGPYLPDFEFIGETCTQLKCLHVDILTSCMINTQPSAKTFPNLRTVECLIVRVPSQPRWVEFLITQCQSIKTLFVDLGECTDEGWVIPEEWENPLYSTIENVLKRPSLLSWVVIEWSFNYVSDDNFVEELRHKYPNFHLAEGCGWIKFPSEKYDFYSFRLHTIR